MKNDKTFYKYICPSLVIPQYKVNTLTSNNFHGTSKSPSHFHTEEKDGLSERKKSLSVDMKMFETMKKDITSTLTTTNNIVVNKDNNFNHTVKDCSSTLHLNTSFSLKKEHNTTSKIRIKHRNPKPKSVEEFGPFLNDQSVKVIEVKNPTVKRLIHECGGYGPYYSRCPVCNNKNLGFFKDLKTDDAVKILSFIKKSKIKQN